MTSEPLTPNEVEMRRLMEELRDKHGAVAIKLGTTEGTGRPLGRFELVDYVHRLSLGILPVWVKVPGPEAHYEIKQLSRIGVQGIICSMTESAYAIWKFVKTLHDEVESEKLKQIVKGMNLESAASYESIDSILKAPEIKEIDHVTVGTHDLSRATGRSRDDPEVRKMAGEITRKAQAAGLSVSVSGVEIWEQIINEIKPDLVNMGRVFFDPKRMSDIKTAGNAGRELEALLLQHELAELKNEMVETERRIDGLRKGKD